MLVRAVFIVDTLIIDTLNPQNCLRMNYKKITLEYLLSTCALVEAIIPFKAATIHLGSVSCQARTS